MRSIRTILAAGLAVLALAAALSVPALAMADTGDASGTVVTTTTPVPSVPTTPVPVPPSKKLVLQFRTEARLRLAAFNADAALLGYRIGRLGTIATRVHKHGANVTQVRAELKTARSFLAQSRQQAIIAAAELRLVPYAADRKVALAKANADFTSARGTLKTARSWKKKAATDLWALVKQYKLTHTVSASDFA
jgi:hypothetical protein